LGGDFDESAQERVWIDVTITELRRAVLIRGIDLRQGTRGLARYDPEHASDIDIRFTAEGPSATLVELTHYNLERHGAYVTGLRDKLDGPGAWISILEAYDKRVREEEPA
jgi:hypothetical protein